MFVLLANRLAFVVIANDRRTTDRQTNKTPHDGGVNCMIYDQHQVSAFLRPIPIRPINPEPNNHTAAGTGTALTSPE